MPTLKSGLCKTLGRHQKTKKSCFLSTLLVCKRYRAMSNRENVLQGRLEVLQCPFRSHVSLSDQKSLQKLTCWLEDTHIRRRPIRKRKPLRSSSFLAALSSYLRELDAEVTPSTDDDGVVDAVQWLVDFAVHLQFEDGAEEYNIPADPWEGRCIPVIPGAAEDPQILDQVHQLLKVIDVDPTMFSAAEGIKIVADVVEERLGEDVEIDDSAGTTSIEELPLGFSTSDTELDRLAKILRILHVRELRKLQNRINTAIADMQSVTANPKTDSKLGRVGR